MCSYKIRAVCTWTCTVTNKHPNRRVMSVINYIIRCCVNHLNTDKNTLNFTDLYVHTHMHTPTHMHACVCLYIMCVTSTYVCTHTHTHTLAYTHMHIHARTHTQIYWIHCSHVSYYKVLLDTH